MTKPSLLVLVQNCFFLSIWTRTSAFSALRSALVSEFPLQQIFISETNENLASLILVTPQHYVDDKGVPIEEYEAVPDELMDAIGARSASILVHHERQALAAFRKRVDGLVDRLSEYKRRPQVLVDFMSEASALFGMVVETDLAMLMASDHFSRIAKENPDTPQTFIRGDFQPGEWGIPYSHIQTASQCVANFGSSGRNRIVRDKAVIISLFGLWEARYRREISNGRPLIDSDFFGDLCALRNSYAHNGSRPRKTLKVVVERRTASGWKIDMDELFHQFAAELNRLALICFHVETHFTFTGTSGGFAVVRTHVWHSDHRLIGEHDPEQRLSPRNEGSD